MKVQRNLRRWGVLVAGVLVLGAAQPSAGAVTVYFDLASFNAAADSPPVVVNFDTMLQGTDITGDTLSGITFNAGPAPSAPLTVVASASTDTPAGFSGVIDASTNMLPATSGEMILSPGGSELGPGPNPAVEGDNLELIFDGGVSAIGFDILFQSLDNSSYTSVDVYGPEDQLLYSVGSVPTSGYGGAPGGSVFVGFVSASGDISRIVVTDYDENAVYPDCNIGFDTFRMTPAIPAPGALVLAAIGAGLAGAWRRRGTR